MRKLHFTLGDKGGIGKSFIAALMTQYIMDNVEGARPVCLDLDMKNATFSRYAGLGAELIDVRTDGDIDRSKFDLLINRVITAGEDAVIIADVGSNVYVPMTDYMRINEGYEMLMGMGTEITLHVPIVGGGDLFPTLQTLDEIMGDTPEDVMVSVWINQKNGRVEYQGRMFEESDRYFEYRKRIRSVTYIPLWRPDMQINLAAMLEESVTFDQALRMDTFDMMAKQLLNRGLVAGEGRGPSNPSWRVCAIFVNMPVFRCFDDITVERIASPCTIQNTGRILRSTRIESHPGRGVKTQHMENYLTFRRNCHVNP